MSQIKNPKSGRKIFINGGVYKDLLKEGYDVNNRSQFPIVGTRARDTTPKLTGATQADIDTMMAMSLYDPQALEDLARLAKAPYQKRIYERLTANKGKGRGRATRGWSLRSPQKGTQRHKLMKACGAKCFLGEGESFPICPKCEVYEGDCRCEIDCDGVNAAFVRAQQWKYPKVSKAAQRILREKCKRNPKARK